MADLNFSSKPLSYALSYKSGVADFKNVMERKGIWSPKMSQGRMTASAIWIFIFISATGNKQQCPPASFSLYLAIGFKNVLNIVSNYKNSKDCTSKKSDFYSYLKNESFGPSRLTLLCPSHTAVLHFPGRDVSGCLCVITSASLTFATCLALQTLSVRPLI